MRERTENIDLHTDVVYVGKRSKTVKGGRKFRFVVIAVAGDKKGQIGIGFGKATEVADARDKALNSAKKNLIRIPLKEGRTLHHDGQGKYCSAKVLIRSAPVGTGIIAGGALRSVLELLGVQDIVVKSTGSSNPNNIIRALIAGMSDIMPPKFIAEKRGMKVSKIIERRES